MNIPFDSISQFLHMGGYAFYVWSAYGSVLVVLGGQGWLTWRRSQQQKN